MTFRQLEVLRALIQFRTTLAAARELGLSQPAVSNAILSLESHLGFALFERVNSRLFPTKDALDICAESESIFVARSTLETRVRDLRENRRGQLRITSTPALGYSIVTSAFEHFLTYQPKTHMFLDVRNLDGVVDAVNSGMAELGFGLGLEDKATLHCQAVLSTPMVCVLRADNPLADKEVVTPADLTAQSFIAIEKDTYMGNLVRSAFHQAGCEFGYKIGVRYAETACRLADSGLGVTVVDHFTASDGSCANTVIRPFFPATTTVAYAAWSRSRPLSRLAEALLKDFTSCAQLWAKKHVLNPAGFSSCSVA